MARHVVARIGAGNFRAPRTEFKLLFYKALRTPRQGSWFLWALDMASMDKVTLKTSLHGQDPRARDWGLCRAAHEKDSCGFGLIASLDDRASHWVLQTAISSLNRLTHRGAIATDGKTGDGCGLLIKSPTGFLRQVAADLGFALAPMFAAGLVFLDRDGAKAERARKVLIEQLQREELRVAGFRTLPTDPSACGSEALKTLPTIEQIFVNANGDIDEATFNRKLFLARRRCEKKLEAEDPVFYVPSLSASTIVYKGMVMPQFLAQFYPDLKDPRMEASVVVFHQRFSTNTLPQWRLAHPYRYLAHNGEINTVQGNRSWAVARGPLFRSPLLPDLSDILPVVSLTGSDSQSLDNMLEVLLVGGLDPMHAMRMLIPPAWQSVDMIDPDLKAFYEYYATHMEPWDGPAGNRAHRRPLCLLHSGPQRIAPGALGHHQESAHHHRIGGRSVGLRAGGCGGQGQARTRRDAGARFADCRTHGHAARR